MNTIRNTNQLSLVTVLIFILFFCSLPIASADFSYEVLIQDYFHGNDLDTNVWTFHTHPNNNAFYEVGNDMIVIHSGEVYGSGGSIRSKQLFNPGNDILIFETRARETAADGGWWGFHSINEGGNALIGFHLDGTLWVEVRPDASLPAVHVRQYGLLGE